MRRAAATTCSSPDSLRIVLIYPLNDADTLFIIQL